jgi:hypothetical protein
MARNLRAFAGDVQPDLGHAPDLVDQYLKGRA